MASIRENEIFNIRQNQRYIEEGMKIYEKRELINQIPKNRPFIIRLSGNTYTKLNILVNTLNDEEIIQGFDKSINLIMINTARNLLNDITFRSQLVYTIGDEIDILFKSANVYQGDTLKYLTLLSSKATKYFRDNFSRIFTPEKIQKYSPETLIKINEHLPTFEARLIYFPEDKNYEIINYFSWRSKPRNSIQDYSITHMTGNSLKNKNNDFLTGFYRDNGINIEQEIPTYVSQGVFIKKRLYKSIAQEKDGNSNYNVIYSFDFIWSMQFKYNDDMLEEFLSKYFNGDKWDEIYNKSYVLSFETYQNIFVNQIPTQINNFANIQSFDNQSKEIQTTSQSFVIDIRDKIKEFKNNGLIYLIPFISFFLIYLNFYRLLNNYCLNSIIEEMGDFNMIYSLFLYYINKKEQKVPYIYENMIISIIVFLAINTGLISYLLIPKFIQNYTYYIVVLGTYYYSIFLSIFMLF